MRNLKLDLVFKFLLADENSPYALCLLHTIISSLIRDIKQTRILNTDYLQKSKDDKLVRYDIKCEDEYGHHYDIEMQNTSLTFAQVKRFELYGAKLVNENVHTGDDYQNLKQNVQIIFIDDINHERPCLYERYCSRNDEGDIEGYDRASMKEDMLAVRIYVYLPYIDIVKKKKGLENMDDFELIVYMLNHGIDEEIRKLRRKVVEIMDRRSELFYQEKKLYDAAWERQVELMTQNAEKEEYRQKGMKEGEKIGRAKGKNEGQLYTLTHWAQSKYPNKDLKWLKLCNEEQLNSIMELLMKNLNYDEFHDCIKKELIPLL